MYHGKWGKARHDYPCAPLEIRPQQVHWYGADWYLPAVYACAQGMVFHLFSAVPEEEFRAFYDRWAARAEELDRMEAEQAEAENPLAKPIGYTVRINGREAGTIRAAARCGCRACRRTKRRRRCSRITALRRRTRGRAWRCMRVQLPWATKRRPERLRSLSVTLKPDPVTLPCPAVFETSPDCAPFDVKFALPSGAEHTLRVLGCAPDRLAEPIRDEASLWPREFCVLRYTVTPALPGEIQLQPADRSQGDPPRRPGKAKGSVVIGGAAAVCLLQPKEDAECAAASALYFEPPQSVAWRLRLSARPTVGQADLVPACKTRMLPPG